MELRDRARGVMVGAAAGDALGMPLEFGPPRRGDYRVAEMRPGRLPAGTFTDDTEMGLALATSLAEGRGFRAEDVARRWIAWMEADPPDIGGQTQAMLSRQRQALARGALSVLDPTTPSAGNGSIMRCFPVPLAYSEHLAECLRVIRAQGVITHPAQDCAAGCAFMGAFIWQALHGASRSDALAEAFAAADDMTPAFRRLLEAAPERSAAELRNSGWVCHTLETALWALATTSDYEGAVVAAANLGNDADTAACVVGAMAGALYGLEGIPARWRGALQGEYPRHSGRIWRESDLVTLADQLVAL